ncbi:GNAT family N-acetyltransferase [Puniceicoccaceae bacterium K14]|nr:GNAT family N-acetyltransferase [Puniceicoccaceae bacterium K14]
MNEIISADLLSLEHSKDIVFLLNEYAKDEMGGGSELAEYTKEHLVEALRSRPNCHVVLAYSDKKPAGLAINFEGFSTFACRPILNVHDFVVAPDFRGVGLAKELLAKVEEIARKLGCCKLTLEVLEGNKLAQSVYRKFGFDGYELDPKMGQAIFYEKKLD